MITPGLWLFYIVLIEVPMAILANRGLTDDAQRAITKVHLTFDLKGEALICYVYIYCIIVYLKLKDVSFFYLKQRIF